MTTMTALPADARDTVAVHGTCDERFTTVRDVLATNLASGTDLGASAAVFIDGEPVVDIWGGFSDAARTRPWARDTIVNTFSTTKTMTALCALILADRGALALDAPVAKYWPEFAAEGKRTVLVRHLLAHTAGLPGWDEPMTIADILDHDKAVALLARQAPWWEPGTRVGYHAITFGPLVGEVVRRVTGRSLGRFFAEEVAGPLGADYHIGTGPECDARITVMIAGTDNRPRTGAGTITDRVFFNPYVTPEDSGTIAWRRGELGGSNGHGNARSVALVQSVLACGGELRGTRLLSQAGCERALEPQADETDLVCGYPLRWGLGYGLDNPSIGAFYGHRFAGRRIAFWGGAGGSVVVNDFDARMTVAFVMNRHLEHGGIDPRGIAIVCAAYDSLLGR
jgi:CubicO group peptidase (beta-lactamase class C family)